MSLALEILLPVVQLCLGIAGWKLVQYWRQKAEDIGKRVPTVGYFHARVAVRKWLNSKQGGEDRNVMERIKQLLAAGEATSADRKESVTEIETIDNISPTLYYNTIEDILAKFLNKSVGEDANKETVLDNYRKALKFEITRKVLKRPSDILGQRKATAVQNKVDEIVDQMLLDPTKSKMSSVTSFGKSEIKMKQRKGKAKIFIYLPILIPVAVSLVFYCLDYSSDFGVNQLYSCIFLSTRYPNGQLSNCSNASPTEKFISGISAYFCPSNNTFVPSERLLANLTVANAETQEEALFVMNMAIGYNFLFGSFIGWIIFFTSIPPSVSALRSLWNLIGVKAIMKKEIIELNDKDHLKKVFQFFSCAATLYTNLFLAAASSSVCRNVRPSLRTSQKFKETHE